MGCWLENIFLWTTLCENGYVFHGYCSSLFLFFFFLYIRVGCVSLSIMKVLFLSDPAPNKTFVSNFPSPHLGWHLLFLGQGEMSPGGDGHPAIAGVAASAHDAQPVIVTHSAIASVAELIDFIWFWIRRLNGW